MTTGNNQQIGAPAKSAPADSDSVRRIILAPMQFPTWRERLKEFLFSYEHLLVFYLLSGQLKDVFTAYGTSAPVDISLASGAMLVGLIGWAALVRRELIFNGDSASRTIGILFVALVGVELMSLVWSHSTDWGQTKSFKLLTIVPAFFAAQFWPKFSPVRFMQVLTVYALINCAWFVSMRYSLFFGEWDETSGAFAVRHFYLGPAIAAATVFVIHACTPIAKPFPRTIFVVAALILTAMTSARGPILFAVLAVMFAVFWHMATTSRFRISPRALPPILLALGALFATTVIFSEVIFAQIGYSLDRFEALILYANPARSHYYTEAFSLIAEEPWFGYGLGSYGVVTSGVDHADHPHNFFLEMWFESGMLGLVCAVALIGALGVKLAIGGNMIHRAMFLFVIGNMMKSGSIDDQKLAFGLLGVAMVIAVRQIANARHNEERSDEPMIAPRRPPQPSSTRRAPPKRDRNVPEGLWLPHYDDISLTSARDATTSKGAKSRKSKKADSSSKASGHTPKAQT